MLQVLKVLLLILRENCDVHSYLRCTGEKITN